MTTSLRSTLARPLFLAAVAVLTTTGFASAQHPAINLMDVEGNVIDPIHDENAEAPFSTKMTCGMCHDYDEITKGYHFQMGWDVISDDYGVAEGRPWSLSNGLMGRWYPYAFRQLAKKHNDSADEIDLTVYDFVGFSPVSPGQPPCGACHPGGGGLEFDRDGNRYDEHLGGEPRPGRNPRRRLPREPLGQERRGRGRLPDLPSRGLSLRGPRRSAHVRQLQVGGGGRVADRHRGGDGPGRAHADGPLREAPVQRRRDDHPGHVVASPRRELRLLPRQLRRPQARLLLERPVQRGHPPGPGDELHRVSSGRPRPSDRQGHRAGVLGGPGARGEQQELPGVPRGGLPRGPGAGARVDPALPPREDRL